MIAKTLRPNKQPKTSSVFAFYKKYKGKTFTRQKTGEKMNWNGYLSFVKNNLFPEQMDKNINKMPDSHITRIMNIAAALINKKDFTIEDKPGFKNGVWANNFNN
jgi:hypothetical protein